MGWTLRPWPRTPSFSSILLLEAFNLQLGHIDRQLTMLAKSGHLDGLVGIAVGQYTECGVQGSEGADRDTLWVLRDG